MEESFYHVGSGSPRPQPAGQPPPSVVPQELLELEQQNRQLRAECEMYRQQLALLDRDGERDRIDDREFERAQERLASEEEALLKQHTEMMEQKQHFDHTMAELRAEAQDLDQEEQAYWQEYNAFTIQRGGFTQDRDCALVVSKRLAAQYDVLSSTNVYNDSFYIWHDGNFGTINGFRLGRLPEQQVDWPEINAAWGQVVLLLHTMVKQKGFEFQNRRLQPMGSFSSIIEGSETLDLHGSGGWFTTFDRGMIAFLQCLKEFGEHAESSDSSFKLPYHIEGDKIGVLSKADKWFPIKRRFEKDEMWTNALKYMLTNLKWLVAWLCRKQGR
jgi:beclin 1